MERLLPFFQELYKVEDFYENVAMRMIVDEGLKKFKDHMITTLKSTQYTEADLSLTEAEKKMCQESGWEDKDLLEDPNLYVQVCLLSEGYPTAKGVKKFFEIQEEWQFPEAFNSQHLDS